MTNDDCMSTTCSATGISAFFRKDLFHTNSQNAEHLTKQKSKYVPNKRYWRPVGRNMKFSFLSFGFENL